jgi:hypothetical protein
VEVSPEAASAVREVETPGRVRGERVTAPLISEEVVAVWAARRAPGVQTVCGEQSGVRA